MYNSRRGVKVNVLADLTSFCSLAEDIVHHLVQLVGNGSDQRISQFRVAVVRGSRKQPTTGMLSSTALGRGSITSLDFHPHQSQYLAASASDRRIRIIDIETGTIALDIEDQFSRINAIEFSPDGKRLATACNGRFGRENGVMVRLLERARLLEQCRTNVLENAIATTAEDAARIAQGDVDRRDDRLIALLDRIASLRARAVPGQYFPARSIFFPAIHCSAANARLDRPQAILDEIERASTVDAGNYVGLLDVFEMWALTRKLPASGPARQLRLGEISAARVNYEQKKEFVLRNWRHIPEYRVSERIAEIESVLQALDK